MKILLSIILILLSTCVKCQCNDNIGYDKKDGLLVCRDALTGYTSNIDTATKVFLFAKLVVGSHQQKDIMMYGAFDKSIGIIDASTRVRFIFQDNSSITIAQYGEDENNNGVFATIISDKYDLLFLKTKSVIAIEITGNQLNAMTYKVDFSKGMDFMLDMECIEQYL